MYHMHSYAAACILPSDLELTCDNSEIIFQGNQKYAIITIKEPFNAPFTLIHNEYKTLMLYMEVNGIRHKEAKEILSCFEKEYKKDGISYMDVYIAVDL